MRAAMGISRSGHWTDDDEALYTRFTNEWTLFFNSWHYKWFYQRHDARRGPRFIVEDYSDLGYAWWGIKHWDFAVTEPGMHGVPEGGPSEWRQILRAVVRGDAESFKRVACEPRGDCTLLYSPRNANDSRPRDWLLIPTKELIGLIRGFLGETS